MAHSIRRLHHRRSNRKLHPIAILGICLGAAVLLALIIGNILNATLDEAPTQSEEPSDSTQTPPMQSAPSVRAYPFSPNDKIDILTSEDGYTISAVSVSINTPDGEINYQSAVSQYLGLNSNSEVALENFMPPLTLTVSRICGVFYPQIPITDDLDLLYAVAATDAALLREFILAGGSEILLMEVSLEEKSLAAFSNYIGYLELLLGNTPIGLSVPMEFVSAEDSWETLPTVLPLADFTTVDLRAVSDEGMEAAINTAKYYADQYGMRPLLSAVQVRWISVAESEFSNFQIVSASEKAAK